MSKLYCPKKKTLFSVSPKCGEESIRYLILKEENIYNPEKIWRELNLFSNLNIKNVNYIYNIIIVRNPYDRLVSGYIDKFLTGNYYHLQFCQNAKKYYNINDDNIRISFQQLVDYLITQPKKNLDAHFQPQHLQHNNIDNNIDNSIILKMENTNKINNILKYLGFTPLDI